LKVSKDSLNVTLDLPSDMKRHRIHPTFHIKLICPHQASDANLFPNRSLNWAFNIDDGVDGEWHVDEIIDHRFSEETGWEFRVLWTLGDRTWELLEHCDELDVLDRYLELRGCKRVDELLRNN
jgi:hypothetical protein